LGEELKWRKQRTRSFFKEAERHIPARVASRNIKNKGKPWEAWGGRINFYNLE